jgi:hypothetical protein
MLGYRVDNVGTKIWEISMNMTARKLTKPVYKRQQFLLSFFRELDEPLTAIEIQKLLFLYLTQNNLPYYDFVPYSYGGFSIQAAEDINTLQAMGWLGNSSGKIRYAVTGSSGGLHLPFEAPVSLIPDQLPKVRGNRLVKLVYERYPYYAINSRMAPSLMNAESLTRIKAEKERLAQTGQMLFTIGYEGVSVEKYLNTLIQNDVRVLCDVRSNPLSRKFGFSRNNLQKYLGNIGIAYVHIPELGIVSAKRQNLNGDEDYQNLFKDYKTSLSRRKEFLKQVYQLLQTKGRIALTCFEHEPSHCHRHVIRDYLKATYRVETGDL